MSDTTDSPKSHQDGVQATQESDVANTSIPSNHLQSQISTANEARYGSPLLQDSFVYNRYFQAHNEEEEVVSALVVEGPDRDLRQPRSSGGKLAYVIFGDQSTGVYYNWNSCEYKLNSYAHHGNRKPRYYGYASYDEANIAWAFYLEKHIVPFSPVDGGVAATPVSLAPPMTPQRNRLPNVQSRSFSYTPHLSPTSPSRATLTSSPPFSPLPLPPLYSPFAPLSQPQTMFFIVMVGYNPGVFSSRRIAAINSRSDGPILEAASRDEANQMFVDAYMTDRVQRLS